MTKEQITKYEYCKKHIEFINWCKKELPFGVQKYGCGTGRPNIECDLEKIHQEMYHKIVNAIDEAETTVQNIMDDI